MTITNPILPGFNPDPSICFDGERYYIAVSTFQWFPGVTVYESTDLRAWSIRARPLDRPSLLAMAGVPSSGGVWAPDLTYNGERFFLAYSNMTAFRGPFKDSYNYLTTAPTIDGPWSEPVFLNRSGFDPGIFHAPNGRIYLLTVDWDPREGAAHRDHFAGILLQEIDAATLRPRGDAVRIFAGSSLGVTEGPHLYFHDGRYHLLVAEGGTGPDHAVTMARSREITGPYEIHPDNPVLTSVGSRGSLRRAGHGDLLRTPAGEWYMVHLCSRPLSRKPDDPESLGPTGLATEGYSPLGRETAIQQVRYHDDGWFRLASPFGTADAKRSDDAPAEMPKTTKAPVAGWNISGFLNAEGTALSAEFYTLRAPLEEDQLSLTARPGYLRLYGEESPRSHFRQSLVATRLRGFAARAEVTLEFNPRDYRSMAGLMIYYNERKYAYCRVTRAGLHPEDPIRIAVMTAGIPDVPGQSAPERLTGPSAKSDDLAVLRIRAIMDHEELRFEAELADHDAPLRIGPSLDLRALSDEAGALMDFTGTMVGVACQDLSGARLHADFRDFRLHYG